MQVLSHYVFYHNVIEFVNFVYKNVFSAEQSNEVEVPLEMVEDMPV